MGHSEAENHDHYDTKSPNPIRFTDTDFALSPNRHNRDGTRTHNFNKEFKNSRNVNTLNMQSISNNLVSGTFDQGTKTQNN